MGKKRIFKMVFCDAREALMEMSGSALKVWMELYLRSGADNRAKVSNYQIAAETGLNLQTVKLAKKWLKDNGWLTVIEESQLDANKMFTVPVVEVLIPNRGAKTTPVTKDTSVNDETGVDFPSGGKTTPQYPYPLLHPNPELPSGEKESPSK